MHSPQIPPSELVFTDEYWANTIQPEQVVDLGDPVKLPTFTGSKQAIRAIQAALPTIYGAQPDRRFNTGEVFLPDDVQAGTIVTFVAESLRPVNELTRQGSFSRDRNEFNGMMHELWEIGLRAHGNFSVGMVGEGSNQGLQFTREVLHGVIASKPWYLKGTPYNDHVLWTVNAGLFAKFVDSERYTTAYAGADALPEFQHWQEGVTRTPTERRLHRISQTSIDYPADTSRAWSSQGVMDALKGLVKNFTGNA